MYTMLPVSLNSVEDSLNFLKITEASVWSFVLIKSPDLGEIPKQLKVASASEWNNIENIQI